MATPEELSARVFGTVVRVNDDGTAIINLNMDSPEVCEIVGGFLVGGTEEANRILRDKQSITQN